ncbi:RHS repeat-associated core domain-containing protein, partial [Pseudomonas sp. ANT_H4]|uniref:RHS repeat domain-containing protein n=2 Tax=unclassified Pseudomonas TaxID=196821 RepID=UPI001253A04B
DGTHASYRYDPFGRRIAKTLNGQTTEFFWQGDTLIAEHSADHHQSYIYEPNSFRPLALLEGFGPNNVKPFHYQLDHLGTPQELTNPDGEIVWSAHYRAYGQIAKLDVNTVNNPLRFQGQYFDQESGLHYNRHRYYNPDNGRYLTPDPVKLAGGLNGYQYVPNPTGWVDPLGLNSCPGGDRCKPGAGADDPTTKANVDEGEPALPRLSRSERQARIDELGEANAKRRVEAIQKRYDMHTIEKHSPEVPKTALKQRTIDGTDPSTGQRKPSAKGNLSSQFNSWRLQLNAINKAITRTSLGLDPFTGKDQQKNPIVRLEQPNSGRGYRPNKKDKQNPTYNEQLNWLEVKFDKADSTRPFTAFPSEKK